MTQLERQTTAANNYRIMVTQEIDCLKSIIKVAVNERQVALTKLKEIRAILRTPKLYAMYKEKDE